MASFENANYICTCYAKKCDRNCRTYRRFTHIESNADRIRSMTDEEMAGFMFRTFGKAAWCLDNKCPPEESCDQCWLDWLKQESEGE